MIIQCVVNGENEIHINGEQWVELAPTFEYSLLLPKSSTDFGSTNTRVGKVVNL